MAARKVKIFMTTDTVGGVWNYSLDLCRALMPYNLEIHLLGLGAFPDENQQKEVKSIPNISFYPSNLKLEWMDDPDIKKTNKKIEILCDIIQPDIFHFNNFVSKNFKRNIPRLTVFHSCVQTWWQAVKGGSAPEEWNGYKEHLEKSCNLSDVVVFPTDAIRKSAVQAHNITSDTQVIFNARELEPTCDDKKEKIILCTGRIWDEAKNLMILCKLADKLPWPIYVAGDNSHPNTSEKIVLDNIRFLGKLTSEELRFWLERTEIYINPALYEPFGLAVLEAAKCHCALALSKLDTLQEVWEENALYFQPKDEDDMLKTLLQLIENDALRKEYQQRAKQHSEKYQLAAMGDAYFELYTSLLTKQKDEENSGELKIPKIFSKGKPVKPNTNLNNINRLQHPDLML